MDGVSLLTVTVLAVFVGFEVVSKVSSTLHTPLMSGANAIHGIILVGAIIVAGQAHEPLVLAVALLAVVLATANLVGGFVVTDRMLEMFRGRKPGGAKPGAGKPDSGKAGAGKAVAGKTAPGAGQAAQQEEAR
jgi:NAD(P) transhydrogenase subunit alpha